MFTTSSAPPAAWREDRAGRAPRVLADRDRDPHAGDDEQRAVDGGRREVALLVEHRVVGQQVLAVHAEHPAVRAHRGGVEEVAPRFGEPDDRGRAPGARRDLLERLTRLRHERRAQQQVFGRVAGDRELGEGDEIAARRLGAVVGIEDARRVAVEVADHEIELRGRDAEPGHALRIRDTAGHAQRPRRVPRDRPS